MNFSIEEYHANLKETDDRIDELKVELAALKDRRIAELETLLAERDRMLRIAYGEASEYVGFMSPDEWFDFLRARAKEGSDT